MSLTSHPFAITEQQRDRAVEHLQACYASNSINESELDRRLDMALGARDRVELNRSLQGLARITPAVMAPLRRRRPGEASPAENVGSGLIHLSGLATSFVGPAIARAVATPGSRIWWEASRAFSLQVSFAGLGIALLILTAITGGGGALFLGWAAWVAATIWSAVRAFNGQSSTGGFEPLLLARPQRPARQLA